MLRLACRQATSMKVQASRESRTITIDADVGASKGSSLRRADGGNSLGIELVQWLIHQRACSHPSYATLQGK